MSDGPVTVDLRGDLALVTIDNPPVNATGHAVRAGLVAALGRVAADPAVRGAVLLCAGRTFAAGADIAEFDALPLAPSLRDCCAALDRLPKPVVAALHGTALGGGLELALACHYRVVDPAGSLGLPEVTLGLVPGAGGTQRLPRLIGAAPALDIMTSGRRVLAEEALRLGLVDAVTAGDRAGFAIDFLRARLNRPLPNLAARPFPAARPDEVGAARAAAARRSPGQVAPLRAIEVVERSAGLGFDAGLALERDVFDALRPSAQAKALRHVFLAERAVGKVPGGGAARRVEHVGVVGGGTMGTGIAAACLLAGLRATVVERDEAALAAARTRIGAVLDEATKRGKLARPDREAIDAGRLRAGTDMASLGEADLVIEAVFESLDAKRDVFRALDAVAKPGAVLATNTSYLDVAAVAAATARPADVIGLHFFSPAHIVKLLEVVVPDGAAPDAVATGFALARRLGKLGVWAGNREGFVGNRVLSAYRRAADATVEDGASPYEVDAAFLDLGFPMGLYAMQDLAGLDIGWATRKRLAPTRDPAERYVAVSDRLCERGWLGRKTGRGYYTYDGGAPAPNPAVETIVAAERAAKGVVPRAFACAEIQNRVLLAMANEGAKLLGEGVALRAGDVDAVMVNGFGFPRHLGGPMHAAGARGLAAVRADLAALSDGDPLWRVAPLIERLAAEGGTFD